MTERSQHRGGDSQDAEAFRAHELVITGRFASLDAAGNAAEALRRAGYRAEAEQAVWQPVRPDGRYTLPIVAGVVLGTIAGVLLAGLWWALSGMLDAWDPAALPISRAIVGVVIYLVSAVLGGWLGYRWRNAEVQANAAEDLAGTSPSYAVVVHLAVGEAAERREHVRNILGAYGGSSVAVRRAA